MYIVTMYFNLGTKPILFETYTCVSLWSPLNLIVELKRIDKRDLILRLYSLKKVNE